MPFKADPSLIDPEKIVWEDPPPPSSRQVGKGAWWAVLEAVMARQGEWARIAVYPTRRRATITASNLRDRKIAYPAGGFEFVARSLSDDEQSDGPDPEGRAPGGLWARYLGEEERPRKSLASRRDHARARREDLSFWHWLVKHHDATGAIGELARAAVKDKHWPKQGRAGRLEAVRTYAMARPQPVPKWALEAFAAYERDTR